MPQISIKKEENYTLLNLSGQFIGGDETDTLRAELNNLLSTNLEKVIIDLSDVNYFNSIALGALISAHANLKKKNAKLVLCNVNKNLDNIFTITKLYLVLHIVKTLDDAINF